MEKNLTGNDSLTLISEMISQARNNFQKGAGLPLLVAGYWVAATALVNYALLYIMPHPAYSFHIWWTMIIMWMVLAIIGRKQDKQSLVKTHIDVIVSKLWKAYGYSIVVALASIFGVCFALGSWVVAALITPFLLLLTGLTQYVTGATCRFRPYTISAFIFWAGALLSVALYFTPYGNLHFIVLALCMITGFVVPGHMANKKGGV